MPSSTITKLTDLLIGFNTMVGIEAVIVTSRSGINIASSVPPKANPDTLAAMSSALQSAADILTNRVNKGSVERVVIECERNNIIIVSAGKKTLLMVLTNEKSILGPQFIEISNLSVKVKKLLEND